MRVRSQWLLWTIAALFQVACGLYAPGRVSQVRHTHQATHLWVVSASSSLPSSGLSGDLSSVAPMTTNDALAAAAARANGRNKKLAKRWATGLSLGALCTLWIFSGNGIFTLGFLLTSLIAQSEYYGMIQVSGDLPTRKIGIVSLVLSYVTAAMLPAFHESVMPLSATFLMLWLLVFNKKSATIREISTSLLGMFYIGYLPSFWVRLKTCSSLGMVAPSFFPPFMGSLSMHGWSIGSILTWWTWTSIVFADVGAYFIGKKFGKHKLSSVSKAAGAASPNKTIEGALGGFTSCIVFAVAGAVLMRWPLPFVSGPIYGLLISFIALVGDLTASMMKRDAGVKDTGNILPGHGGLLDRIDSYMFTAPAAFYFCTVFLPFLAKIDGRRGTAGLLLQTISSLSSGVHSVVL